MKLINMKCPQCSGTLEIDENAKQARCPFCDTLLMIDDEGQRLRADSGRQAGYDFEQGRIEAQEERRQAALRAQQEAARKKKNLVWWILGWIFICPVPLTILIARSKKLKPWLKAVLIAALWIVILVIGIAGNLSSDANVKWAAADTPIDQFDYYIDGDSLILTKYKGSDKAVRIAPAYEIEGKSYQVTGLEAVFELKAVNSVIVPEGVTSIEKGAFNVSDVKYLYLPSTLTDFDGWSTLHDGEKLCYGGTQEQWNSLYTGERKDIGFKQITYDVKIDELPTGNDASN